MLAVLTFRSTVQFGLISEKDKRGQTPAALARLKGYDDTAELLEGALAVSRSRTTVCHYLVQESLMVTSDLRLA
jgi:hypothetical protein